jgi:general secretion pathway protein C
MAVSLNPRAERLLARLPRVTVFSLLELLLLVLIAVQCARLFWAALTPLGPLGEWKALDLMRPAAAPGPLLGSFDPFFRQAPGAAAGQAPVV